MFTNPTGLLAFAALPVIVIIYYFRRRFKPRVVSALFLWQVRDRVPAAGRKWEKFRGGASFWLEMAAAALMALAIAGLRGCGDGRSVHFVAVLDGSASMGASDLNINIREKALAEARRRIEALPADATVTLMMSARLPVMLAGPGALRAAALESLQKFEPLRPGHDPATALAMARQFAGEGAVTFITDHPAPAGASEFIEWVSVGSPMENHGFTHAVRLADHAFFTIGNFAPSARTLQFKLAAGDRILAEKSLEVPAGGRKNISVKLPADAPAVEGILEADALDADNHARLAPVPRRMVSVFVDSSLDGKECVALGLATNTTGSRTDKLLTIAADTREADSAGSAHLLITKDVPAGGRAWTLRVRAPGEKREDWYGPWLVDKRHALMEGVTLQGVRWTGDPEYKLSGYSVVSIANFPLITETRDGARRHYNINLDAARSTLAQTPDWPIFLNNLVEARRAELPGAQSTNILVDELFTWRTDDPGEFRVEGPGFERDFRGSPVLSVDGMSRPGFYKFIKKGRAESAQAGGESGNNSNIKKDGKSEELCNFTVNFMDAAESDLSGCASGLRAANAAASTGDAPVSAAGTLLIAGALACALLDWLLLSRRARAGVII